MVTAVVPIGGIIGALLGSKIATIGRRNALILLSIVCTFGSFLTIVLNFYTMIIGRLIFGFACGGYSVVVPLFVSEIAPVSISGALGGLNQFMILSF